MTEDEFTDKLAKLLTTKVGSYNVGRKQSLLYDLSFDHKGFMTMGVDPDSGEPIRGKGKGFEQDLLISEPCEGAHTSVLPRVVAEVKLGSVTTHDVIVYSEKADRIRRVYPYVRYGFVLAGLKNIPGRVLRLGQRFDFITVLDENLHSHDVDSFANLLLEEAVASVAICNMLFSNSRPKLVRKSLLMK